MHEELNDARVPGFGSGLVFPNVCSSSSAINSLNKTMFDTLNQPLTIPKPLKMKNNPARKKTRRNKIEVTRVGSKAENT